MQPKSRGDGADAGTSMKHAAHLGAWLGRNKEAFAQGRPDRSAEAALFPRNEMGLRGLSVEDA